MPQFEEALFDSSYYGPLRQRLKMSPIEWDNINKVKFTVFEKSLYFMIVKFI